MAIHLRVTNGSDLMTIHLPLSTSGNVNERTTIHTSMLFKTNRRNEQEEDY